MKVETTIGTIEAELNVLNEIALAFHDTTDAYIKQGYNGIARRNYDVYDTIWKALNNIGYYDNLFTHK